MKELRTGDRQLIRELNMSIVLDVLRRESPISRIEIAERTGLGRSTVSGIVSTMVERGMVTEVGTAESSGGRRPRLLAFNPDCYYAVGIKVQPRSVVGCVVNLAGQMVARDSRILDDRSASGVIASIVDIVRALIADQKWSIERVLGVGVGMPGIVDVRRGVSISPHFFDWRRVPMKSRLEQLLKIPVEVENDATAAGLGEKWQGVGQQFADFIFVTIGIGIGGSIILGGDLHRGQLVGTGHVGHMALVQDGPPCRCGSRGCLEGLASDIALVRYCRQAIERGRRSSIAADVVQVDTDDVLSIHRARDAIVRAAKAGDPCAVYAIQQVAGYLGMGIANSVKLLGPTCVVVGGETATLAGDMLLEPIRTAVRDRGFSEVHDELHITLSRLGDDVWLIGAASLILEQAFQVPVYASDRGVSAMANL